MTARTPRMAQLEALLADDPDDPFLHYGIAMEHASAGDDAEAARRLTELADRSGYVPAFHQAGQALARLGRDAEAVAILRRGVDAARQQGNTHAAGEMQGLLESLE